MECLSAYLSSVSVSQCLSRQPVVILHIYLCKKGKKKSALFCVDRTKHGTCASVWCLSGVQGQMLNLKNSFCALKDGNIVFFSDPFGNCQGTLVSDSCLTRMSPSPRFCYVTCTQLKTISVLVQTNSAVLCKLGPSP